MKLKWSRKMLGVFCCVAALSAGSMLADDPVALEPVKEFLKLPAEYSLGPCSAVATNSKGELLLFHRGKHPILCVDADGKLLRSWGDEFIGKAHGLRVDRQDNVWVTDIARHRVMKFDPAGKLLLSLGTGKPGTGTDEFDQPTDIAFGNIAYDPTYISRSELALLRMDLEKIIAENRASPDLLFKIYNRIGISNKTTEAKGEKWREDFTEQVERSYKPKPFSLPPQ